MTAKTMAVAAFKSFPQPEICREKDSMIEHDQSELVR
eukprot:UN05588